MELNDLEYVMQLAKNLNYSQTAAQLHISQPALSQKIARMEQEIGARLFERGTHGVSLTQEGEQFIDYAQKVQSDYHQLLQAVRQTRDHAKKNIFRIGMLMNMDSLPLSLKIKEFEQEHPDIHIQMAELVGSGEVLRQAEARNIDIGFFMPSPNLSVSNKLETLTVQKGHVTAVIPREHPFSTYTQVGLQELSQVPLVFPMHAQSLFDTLMTAFKKSHNKPHIISEMSKISTGIKLAVNHNAVALETSFFAEAECRKHHYNAVMLPVMPLIPRNISVAYLKTNYSPDTDGFLLHILSEKTVHPSLSNT